MIDLHATAAAAAVRSREGDRDDARSAHLAAAFASAQKPLPVAAPGSWTEEVDPGLGLLGREATARGARRLDALRVKAGAMAKALRNLGAEPRVVVVRLGAMSLSGGWTYKVQIVTEGRCLIAWNDRMEGGAGPDALSIAGVGEGYLGAPPPIHAGAGDDAVSLSVSRAEYVDAGAGNDALSVAAARVGELRGGDDAVAVAGGSVAHVDGGAGDDALSVAAVDVARLDGGAGDDAVSLRAGTVEEVTGGAGRDALSVRADLAGRVDGGAGDDALSVTADRLGAAEGGDGDDAISVTAARAERVSGGDGDDVISATGGAFSRIEGGAGDDVIRVAAREAALVFGPGAGDDVVEIATAQTLSLDLSESLAPDLDALELSLEGDALRIGFADGGSVTLLGLERAGRVLLSAGGETMELTAGHSAPVVDARI